MLSRGFQIILSALIFICSTLAGMAKTTAQEEVRAEIFEDQSLGGKAGNHIEFAWDDAAILPCTACVPQSVNNSNNFKNQKRNHRRTASPKLHHSKCRILKSLPAKSESRGVARNPQSQDARQELTAAIRFLHLKALAC